MRPCWIFDMDGTLANVSSIRHYVRPTPERPWKDFNSFHRESVNVPPNWTVVDLAMRVKETGKDVVVVTARRERWRNQTAWFLAMNDIPSDALFMRADKDNRPDFDVKHDLLAAIRRTWDVRMAVDDNPAVIALWQSEGIPTITVPGWEQ